MPRAEAIGCGEWLPASDTDLASIRSNTVPGVFSVANNLRVEGK